MRIVPAPTVIDRWNARRDRVAVQTEGEHGGADNNMVNNLFEMLGHGAKPLACIEDRVWAVALGTSSSSYAA